MSIAKVIALLGSFIYLLIFIGGLFFPDQIKAFVSQNSQLTSRTVQAIIISFAFFLTIVNLCYFYYLNSQTKKDEDVSSAAFLGLQLIILPIMLLAAIMVVFVI